MYQPEGLDHPVPLFVPSWSAATRPGQPRPVDRFSQDADGWIEIRDADTLAFPDWVLHWPTPPEGRYSLHVECGDDAGNVVGSSEKVAFKIDNVPCEVAFGQMEWSVAGANDWQALPPGCPVIRRPRGAAIELRVPWSADSPHFRDAYLTFTGCAGSDITPVLAEPADDRPVRQWHESVYDTHGGSTATYGVGATSPEGAYTLRLHAWTRATHPDFDPGPSGDFRLPQSVVGRELWRAIAIVDRAPGQTP
jgi:hypothetical protein